MLPVEDGPDGEAWFVGFEWTGRANYLNEWADGASSATRGANATSADAVVRFEREGEIETLLIEWKYTEKYGAPLNADGNPTRVLRYSDKIFTKNGPIRAVLVSRSKTSSGNRSINCFVSKYWLGAWRRLGKTVRAVCAFYTSRLVEIQRFIRSRHRNCAGLARMLFLCSAQPSLNRTTF